MSGTKNYYRKVFERFGEAKEHNIQPMENSSNTMIPFHNKFSQNTETDRNIAAIEQSNLKKREAKEGEKEKDDPVYSYFLQHINLNLKTHLNYYQIIYSFEQFSPTYKIDDFGAFIQDSENRYMKRTGNHQYNEKYLRNQRNAIANFLSFVRGIDVQKYLKNKHI